MSRLPIRLRLALVFGLVMAVVFTAVGAFLYIRLGATLDERIADSLESRATALSTVLLGAGDVPDLDPALIAGEDGVAQVIGSDGSLEVASPTVEDMRRRATEISADTPERRLPLPRAHDEVYRLGATLNEMLDRLDEGLARERRFVADASHELRTPLATLQTELELATRRPRSHAELEDALRSATEEVERLVRLAEDLLVLARADEGQVALQTEPFVVREALEAVAARHGLQAAAAARSLEVSAPADLTLSGDRPRLEQALGNLVDNALRHGQGTVRLEALTQDGVVLLAVSDEGAGFTAEFLPHAFERFSRPDEARSGGGTGLGLAIAQAIAVAHGGSAGAANRSARGADVWLVIPATPGGPESPGSPR